jgi:carboxyl-terminal processing protease
MRRYAPYARAQGGDPWEVETSGGGEQPPDGSKVFTKPVVVLTSAFTGSAAEDFCVSFDAMGRGAIIGEPTGGSTGQPLRLKLPGGGSARVCTIESRHPDGGEFVGVGVQPDILVRPTVADVRAGRDTVLAAALDYLAREKAE